MKAGKLIAELEEFERLLKEFERQKQSLLGKPVAGLHDDWTPQEQRVHYSFDDFRLLLIRTYYRLRPYIETYSCCFRTTKEDGTEGEEIYEVVIEKSSADFAVLYDDLEQIRNHLRQYSPDTVLDKRGRPKEDSNAR